MVDWIATTTLYLFNFLLLNISVYNFRMWLHALKRAQSDKQLPTPRHERRNLRPEEIEELEEQR